MCSERVGVRGKEPCCTNGDVRVLQLQAFTLWPRLEQLRLANGAPIDAKLRRDLSRAAREVLSNSPSPSTDRLTYLTRHVVQQVECYCVADDVRMLSHIERRARLRADVLRFVDEQEHRKRRRHEALVAIKHDSLLEAYIDALDEFVAERIRWQDTGVRIRDVPPDEQVDLLHLVHRVLQSTERTVARCANACNDDSVCLLLDSAQHSFDWAAGHAPLSIGATVLERLAAEPLDFDAFAGLHCAVDATANLADRAELWERLGNAFVRVLSTQPLARYCWSRCAAVLELGASEPAHFNMRCRVLRALFESTRDAGLLEAAQHWASQYEQERDFQPHVNHTLPLLRDTSTWCGSLDSDVFAQLVHCRELAEQVLVGSVQLRCGAALCDGISERALVLDLGVTLATALIKLRNVLDHGWARFMRECVWLQLQPKHGVFRDVFQGKLPRTWSKVESLLLKHDKPLPKSRL